MTPPSHHQSVMRDAVIAALNPRDGGFYVDGTFGGGGYSRALLAVAETTVLALDRDPIAVERATPDVAAAAGRLTVVCARFSVMDRVAADHGFGPADGVALDLGLSSDQLDDSARGFSFSVDGPLDMRMASAGATAADLVNTLPEADLVKIIAGYGEERRARAVARAIVAARAQAPITRTGVLAEIVSRAVGGRKGPHTIHPATRTFQALRIAVNGELGELAHGLAAAERLLTPAGRLAVVAFHSLEDRVVKRFFTQRSGQRALPSRHLPLSASDRPPSFRALMRGAQKPDADEIARNPRARSARLRAAERTGAPAFPLDLTELGLPAVAFEGALP